MQLSGVCRAIIWHKTGRMDVEIGCAMDQKESRESMQRETMPSEIKDW